MPRHASRCAQKLAALEAKTTDQLVVATVKSLNGNSVEEYANRLFRRWQLGQRGKNNGVLLLHAPTERKIRIEVGYGLEGTLTDAITKYIIAERDHAALQGERFLRRHDARRRRHHQGARRRRRGVQAARGAATQGWIIPPDAIFMVVIALFVISISMGILLGPIHALLIWLGWAQKKPKSGFWYWLDSPSSYGGSSGSWSSSGSSWSSSGGSSDSFSGGGGDSGGGGSSGDY